MTPSDVSTHPLVELYTDFVAKRAEVVALSEQAGEINVKLAQIDAALEATTKPRWSMSVTTRSPWPTPQLDCSGDRCASRSNERDNYRSRSDEHRSLWMSSNDGGARDPGGGSPPAPGGRLRGELRLGPCTSHELSG
jgi:hypothetical protein